VRPWRSVSLKQKALKDDRVSEQFRTDTESTHPIFVVWRKETIIKLTRAMRLQLLRDGMTRAVVGDALVGCHDPADTAHWIGIIAGRLWDREDGRANSGTFDRGRRDRGPVVLPCPHPQGRLLGVRGRERGHTRGPGRPVGIHMICVSAPRLGCNWIPAVDLRGGDNDFDVAR
jgi:hypothetical protein